jgi:hypothetical protein
MLPQDQKPQMTEEQRRVRIIKALGYPVFFNDFSQTILEKYQVDIIKTNNASFYPVDGDSSRGIEATAVRRGGTLRAAIEHGILTGITQQQAADLAPYIVTWLADEIRAHVLKIVSGPTDPN